MENKQIQVSTCATCPFMVEDTERDPLCYITLDEINYKWSSLRVHEKCPLKETKFTIELIEE